MGHLCFLFMAEHHLQSLINSLESGKESTVKEIQMVHGRLMYSDDLFLPTTIEDTKL